MNHRHPPAPTGCPPMSRRRPNRFSRPAALALLLLAGAALQPLWAQRAGGGLPNDLKNAGNPAARQGEIEKFISTQVTRLQKGKESDRQEARDAIVKESTMIGGQPNAAFLDVYATVLNKQLVPLAKSGDAHVRLNAAIALQKVARNANNAALADAATALANDSGTGVALWATKGAQAILPPLATTGTNTKLTAAVVAAVKKHPDSAEVAEEAYKALTMEFPRDLKRLNAQAVPVLLPDALRLFEFRVGLYFTRTPPAPELEKNGATFLTFGAVWNHPAAAKHHGAIMQSLANLIGVAAQHAAARGPGANKEFIDLLRETGNVLAVVGGAVKDADMQAAAKALNDMPAKADAEQLAEIADKAFEVIKAKFPNTKPAPTIEEGAAAAEPVEDEQPTERPTRGEDDGATSANAPREDADADTAREAQTAGDRTDRPAGKSGKRAEPADDNADEER
jgi:hypothetical protein